MAKRAFAPSKGQQDEKALIMQSQTRLNGQRAPLHSLDNIRKDIGFEQKAWTPTLSRRDKMHLTRKKSVAPEDLSERKADSNQTTVPSIVDCYADKLGRPKSDTEKESNDIQRRLKRPAVRCNNTIAKNRALLGLKQTSGNRDSMEISSILINACTPSPTTSTMSSVSEESLLTESILDDDEAWSQSDSEIPPLRLTGDETEGEGGDEDGNSDLGTIDFQSDVGDEVKLSDGEVTPLASPQKSYQTLNESNLKQLHSEINFELAGSPTSLKVNNGSPEKHPHPARGLGLQRRGASTNLFAKPVFINEGSVDDSSMEEVDVKLTERNAELEHENDLLKREITKLNQRCERLKGENHRLAKRVTELNFELGMPAEV